MAESGHTGVEVDGDLFGSSTVRQLQKRIRDRERFVGKQRMAAYLCV